MKKLIAVLILCLLPTWTFALEKLYPELAIMDLDQVSALVKKKIAESRRSSTDKIGPLKAGLRLVLSRPDDDGMVEKVLGNLRSELEEQDAWEKTMQSVADESIAALKDPGDKEPTAQVTHSIVLQNIIAEAKPYAHTAGYEKALLERIRDAHIELTKAARNERSVRTGKETKSPSDIAATVLSEKKK